MTINTKNTDHGLNAHALHITINNKGYDWNRQYITGAEVRKLGGIPPDEIIHLAIQKPWEDEIILDETEVDLARPGIEHFFTVKPGDQRLVEITITKRGVSSNYQIQRGKHTGADIRQLGNIDPHWILEQLVDDNLVPISDADKVVIKGGEHFYTQPKDGASS